MHRKAAAFVASTLLAAAAAGAPVAVPQEVVDTSFRRADGERVMELSIDVPAPVGEVWAAYATTDGFRSWSAPVARVDMRIGGEMEASYDPAARLGAPGTIRNAVVAVVPERLVVIRNVQAPPDTPFDTPTFQQLQTAVLFAPLGAGTTRVTLQNGGYRDGPPYDGVYAFFLAGNAWTLKRLQERFTAGPVDWEKALRPPAHAPDAR